MNNQSLSELERVWDSFEEADKHNVLEQVDWMGTEQTKKLIRILKEERNCWKDNYNNLHKEYIKLDKKLKDLQAAVSQTIMK